jgi:RB1-inducible coiled-coil protein 1
LKVLAKIPILPALISNEQNSNSSDDYVAISLLEWISQKDNQNSLEQVAEHCSRGLEQFDLQQLSKVKAEVEEILDSCNNSNMKEVKGLEERLYGLEKLMCEAKKIVDEQRDLAQAFYQNQTRASNLRDPSILPDLCASHKQQLEVMLKNHQKLRDYRRRCSRAKEELSGNLHARLRWIMYIEKKLSEIDAKILVYRENLRRLKKHLEVVHQIHLAPKIYMASVVEVVRRKTFSNVFIHWASSLARQSSELIENEISLRRSFSSQLDSHFLQYLFPGMNDYPPRFANDSPIPFDAELPNLSNSDVEYLRNKLPDLSDMLVVPLPVPMPQPSIHECDSHITNVLKDQNKNIQKVSMKSKPSDSDTEEFETVNDESPKWHDSDTKLSSSINEIESPQSNKELCLSVTTDFPIDETNDKFKDVLLNTSFTAIDIEELETKLENFNKQLGDKSNELIEIRENYDKSREELKSKHDLLQSLFRFSSDLISTIKEMKSSLRTHVTDISDEYSSSLKSMKEHLMDWLLMRENLSNEKQIEFNKSVEEYETRIQNMNANIESLRSQINFLEDTLESNKNQIESLNKEIEDKNSEIVSIRNENIETVKQMTLEQELEITALNEDFNKLSLTNQSLEELIREKDIQLDCLRRSHENLESVLLLRFQEEKDSVINALNIKSTEREQLIKNECDEKIKRIERNSEATINELRLRLNEEKAKSLVELKEQLDSGHKNEIESLRHRFKLAISTTSIERTPSESSLEKVQLDIVDQLAQDREINRLKQIILDEKQKQEDLVNKLKKEKDEEIKAIKSSYQGVRQVSFNEALNKLTSERDLLSQELKRKENAFQCSTSIISDIISKINLLESSPSKEEVMNAFQQINEEIKSLVTNLAIISNESKSCSSFSCNCDSRNVSLS